MKKRKSKNISLKRSIYILCEGETEEQYFRMLKQKYHSYNISIRRSIKIKAIGHSGKSLIRDALKDPDIKKQDMVYVVFDRDEHTLEELQVCQKLIVNTNIRIIFSSICFEIWLLMHFEPVNRAYDREKLFQKLSQADYFGVEYKKMKGDKFIRLRPFLYDKVAFAKNNADELYKRNNDWLRDDPFTNVNCYLKEIFQVETL